MIFVFEMITLSLSFKVRPLRHTTYFKSAQVLEEKLIFEKRAKAVPYLLVILNREGR